MRTKFLVSTAAILATLTGCGVDSGDDVDCDTFTTVAAVAPAPRPAPAPAPRPAPPSMSKPTAPRVTPPKAPSKPGAIPAPNGPRTHTICHEENDE